MLDIINNLAHDNVGMIHLVSAILATVFGTMVLVMKKGTANHVRAGYAYTISMVVMLITAFMIYRLFGGFGIFHIAAIVSTFTLAGGMIPVIRKRPRKRWLEMHLAFMYWSVIGLYAAFASETLTRIPDTPFFGMVGIATFAIMLMGTLFYRRYLDSWKKTIG